MAEREVTILHLFSGIGGAAIGFQEAHAEYRGVHGKFRTLAGIDVDPLACQDFEMLTGAKAVPLDLFSRQDYIAFHGNMPPEDWKETTAEDIRTACGGENPDVIFLSPPCKGFSGLLPADKAKSEKYQALNRLVVRGLALCLEAFADDLPKIIMLENVPRITTRGKTLLMQVKRLLGIFGYLFHEGYHDCGELGGLGQRRKRYLLIARLPAKMTAFVYQPPKQQLKTIGDIIGPLPLPDAPECGPMHRLPRLQWKTWVRLALIPAGGDWRDLENIGPYAIEYVPRGGGSHGVQDWSKPSATVTGTAKVNGSNAACVADPRLKPRDTRHPGIYRVTRFDEPAPCVTGARFGSGSPAVADPRLNPKSPKFNHSYKMSSWHETSGAIAGGSGPSSGALAVDDPRITCRPRNGVLGVRKWDEPSTTVTGNGDIHAGSSAVADPRVPRDSENGKWIIISEDGTWHRPLTTYELVALQGFPLVVDGKPLVLAGNSDARWREAIGNAVPPAAMKAAGTEILKAILVSSFGEWTLGSTEAWVAPRIGEEVAVSP